MAVAARDRRGRLVDTPDPVAAADAPRWRERTPWPADRWAPLRAFMRTESGSAAVLVAAIAAALVWANVDGAGYERVWSTDLFLGVGRWELGDDLRTWVNSGLMTLFFLVVGLETRREFDLGDLRERSRFVLPLVAGVVGMVVPVALFVLLNAGRDSVGGWGVAMSTDTALALGVLAVVGRDVPDRMRVFVLTVFVVDDLAALAVIAVVYSEPATPAPLLLAALAYLVLLLAVRAGMPRRWVLASLGVVIWAGLRAGGIDPIVAGLAIGLATPAYLPVRSRLQAATGLVRRFREEPTPEYVRSARVGLSATLSPNARLQSAYHPWTSHVVVPLFALANAGIPLHPDFLRSAYAAPVTLGVLVAYVVGKPLAVVGTSWVVTRLSGGRLRPPVGVAAVAASGTIAGIGFTVALLVASRAFTGAELEQASARRAHRGRRRRRADLGGAVGHRAAAAGPPDPRPAGRPAPDPGPGPGRRRRARPRPRVAPPRSPSSSSATSSARTAGGPSRSCGSC